MAVTYHLSSTDSDLSGGADFNKALLTGTSSGGTISCPIAAASTETSYAWTPQNVPGTNGTSTGNFTVEINITTAVNNTTVRPYLTRVNSAGTAQAGPIAPAEAAAATTPTGVKTFTWTNPALGTWASGDRLRVEYTFVNSHASAVRTPVLGTNTANEEVITPFTAGALTVTLTGGITPSGAIAKRTDRAVSGGITPGPGALLRGVNLLRDGTLTTAGDIALGRIRGVTLTGGLSFGTSTDGPFTSDYFPDDYFTYEYYAHISGTPNGGLLAKQIHKVLDGTLTTAGDLLKQVQRVLEGTLTTAGDLVAALAGDIFPVTLTATLTTAGNLVKQGIFAYTGVLTTAGELLKRGETLYAGTLTSAGALLKQNNTAYTGALTSAGDLDKLVPELARAGTLTPSGELARETRKILDATLTTAGDIARLINRALDGTLTTAGALLKTTQRALTGTLTTAGAILAEIVTGLVYVVVEGTLTTAGTLAREVQKTLTGTLTTAGTVTRQINKILDGVLSTAGVILKESTRSLTGTLTTAGAILAEIVSGTKYVVLDATFTTAGALSRQISRAVAGTLTTSGTLAKLTSHAYTGTLTTAGALTKRIDGIYAGTLTTAGVLGRLLARGFAGTLTTSGALIKRVNKILSGVLNTVGGLVVFGPGGPVAAFFQRLLRRRVETMPLLIQANEPTATQRRVYFHLVNGIDGMTPEVGEAGGQPQISTDGAAFTNVGIGTLVSVGNGRYYAELAQAALVVGTIIQTRYRSANTAECPGDVVQVVGFDPVVPLIGAGSVSWPVIVTTNDGVTPIEGVAVWVTTDIAGTNVIAGTLYTDALGRINGTVGFMLDPGGYYLWFQRSGWSFANPTAITVV